METIKGWNIFRADDAYKSLGDNLLKLATAGSITTNDMIEVIEGNTSQSDMIERPKPLGTVATDCIRKHKPTRWADGTFGDITMDRLGSISMMSSIGSRPLMSATATWEDLEPAFQPAVKMSALSPFQCPCCGGNKYKRIGDKVVCEFCDTQFG